MPHDSRLCKCNRCIFATFSKPQGFSDCVFAAEPLAAVWVPVDNRRVAPQDVCGFPRANSAEIRSCILCLTPI